MQKKKLFFISLAFIFIMSCQQHKPGSLIKNGDILFRGNNQSGLSEAINEVTQTKKETNYTHMGICQIEGNTIWVIHASAEKGVYKESIKDFCKPRIEINYTTDVYRLNKSFQHSINKAIESANTLLGNPYDSTYIINNDGYYCSEFIYEIFKTDSIFSLNPMTFVNPQTGNFHQGWIDHYNNIGIEIPEGEPGCNPNEMSVSDKLLFVTTL